MQQNEPAACEKAGGDRLPIELSALYRAVIPFVLSGVAVLLLTTCLPVVTTFLPNLMG